MDYDDYRESSELVFCMIVNGKKTGTSSSPRGSEHVVCRLVDFIKHYIFGFQNGFNCRFEAWSDFMWKNAMKIVK